MVADIEQIMSRTADSSCRSQCHHVRSHLFGEPAAMTRAVHVPYTVEQDEDGVWCAHAQLSPGVGGNGEGDTREDAVGDLREALEGLIAEFGAPQELTVMVDVA